MPKSKPTILAHPWKLVHASSPRLLSDPSSPQQAFHHFARVSHVLGMCRRSLDGRRRMYPRWAYPPGIKGIKGSHRSSTLIQRRHQHLSRLKIALLRLPVRLIGERGCC